MSKLKLGIIILGFIITAFLLWKFGLPLFRPSNSFLKITTEGVESEVFLDDDSLGRTPYLGEKLEVGDHSLRLEAKLPAPFNKTVLFSTPITLTAQALTAVNYEFGPSDMFSSGDIRTFRVGEGLSIITSPSGADVWLDGEIVGKSPISLSPNHGVHRLKITHDGFISRELEINIEQDLRLVVEVFLAANPFDEPKKLEEGKIVLYDLSTDREDLLDKFQAWAEGVFFFEKKVKINFDAVVDVNGKTYFKDKEAWDKKIKEGQQVFVGYLGNKNEKSLSTSAQKTIADIKLQFKPTEKPATTKQVQILTTPTGTLNVRSGPSLSNNIIAKVEPGGKYKLLDEQADWYKIEINGATGWISTQYAKKL